MTVARQGLWVVHPGLLPADTRTMSSTQTVTYQERPARSCRAHDHGISGTFTAMNPTVRRQSHVLAPWVGIWNVRHILFLLQGCLLGLVVTNSNPAAARARATTPRSCQSGACTVTFSEQ